MKVLSGQVVIASGPIVYSLEGNKNPGLDNLKIDINTPMKMSFNPGLLGGVNVVTGTAINGSAEKVSFNAIPYFAIGNIQPGDKYEVWVKGK